MERRSRLDKQEWGQRNLNKELDGLERGGQLWRSVTRREETHRRPTVGGTAIVWYENGGEASCWWEQWKGYEGIFLSGKIIHEILFFNIFFFKKN